MQKNGRFKASVGDEIAGGYQVIGMGFWETTRIKNGVAAKTWYYVCKHPCGRTRKFRSIELNKDKQPCKKCEAGKLRMNESRLIIALAEYRKYKGSAKKRSHDFKISFEDYIFLAEAPCNYCGRMPFEKKYLPSGRSIEGREAFVLLGGIDRLDSSMGYTPENCVPACWVCNRAKSTLTMEEWLEMVSLWNYHSSSIKYTAKADYS